MCGSNLDVLRNISWRWGWKLARFSPTVSWCYVAIDISQLWQWDAWMVIGKDREVATLPAYSVDSWIQGNLQQSLLGTRSSRNSSGPKATFDLSLGIQVAGKGWPFGITTDSRIQSNYITGWKGDRIHGNHSVLCTSITLLLDSGASHHWPMSLGTPIHLKPISIECSDTLESLHLVLMEGHYHYNLCTRYVLTILILYQSVVVYVNLNGFVPS